MPVSRVLPRGPSVGVARGCPNHGFSTRDRQGAQRSDAIKLADGVTTVGRHDDCQFRIKSSQVSRRHCELFEKKGLLLVKDLGSSNGTFVNGKRIQDQRVLEPGDELMIGQVTLKVAKVGTAVPGPPARPARSRATRRSSSP